MRTTTIALAAALACGACTSFPDVSTVLDLRVLSVQADPPDVFLTVTGLPSDPSTPIDPTKLGIDPASIPPIRLAPLIVDPRASAGPITWDVTACPNDPYGASPPGSVMGGGMDPGGGANSTVGSTLCSDAKVSWPLAAGIAGDATTDVQLTPDELITAFKSDVFVDQHGNFHGGFDLGMPLNFEIDVHEGGGPATAVAVKRATFWAQTFPGQTLNQIPTIPSVSLFGHRDDATFDLQEPAGTLSATTPTHVSLSTGEGLWLLPEYHAFDPSTPDAPGVTDEHYKPVVLDRDPPYEVMQGPEADERIRYAYYTTAGHFDPPRTANQLAPGAVGMFRLESHWVAPGGLDAVPADASGQRLVTVWVVVRDDRGGESWVSGLIALDP